MLSGACMRPTRVILLVMDSVGIGELPDAAAYGDQGSNTVGNIAREVGLEVPTLRALGLARLVDIGGESPAPVGACARLAEASPGKDSVTGHWELAGLVLKTAFPTYPDGFPDYLMREFERRIGRQVLGNVVASGTEIIDRLGEQHMATGQPIVYTSADSVFQIAAHESVIPVADLYGMCEVAYELACRGLGVGRVIARPFVGDAGHFLRTPNRRDFALEPFAQTLLDHLHTFGHPVVAIGKIEDLFAGRGITHAVHTTSDDHGMDVLTAVLDETSEGLIAVNLVDFDSKYGHRNDVAGYAANLERFDARLAELLTSLPASDLLVVTADHGNDPTTPSTDHSREHVPLLMAGAAVRPGTELGTRSTFADLGQTLAELFGVPALDHGTSFLRDVLR
jgi:phosphopentomutase